MIQACRVVWAKLGAIFFVMGNEWVLCQEFDYGNNPFLLEPG